jgi:hypothetical protein
MEVSNIDVPLREAASAVCDSVQPEFGWTLGFVLDDPGPALVKRSEEAAMLVVGTHEHVGLARLVSGSVSRYCLSHAKCPTVIVPSTIAQSLSGKPSDRRQGCGTEGGASSPCVRRRSIAQRAWKPMRLIRGSAAVLGEAAGIGVPAARHGGDAVSRDCRQPSSPWSGSAEGPCSASPSPTRQVRTRRKQSMNCGIWLGFTWRTVQG